MQVGNLVYRILIVSSLAVLVAGCQSKPSAPSVTGEIQIRLSVDSSAVELHRVRQDVLEYLQSDSIGEKEWQSFFSVYPTPKDPELRDLQRPLPGIYKIRDTTILFIPEKKFEKDSLYFARCYSRQIMDEPSDLVMGRKLSAESEFVEFDFKR